MNDPLAQRDLRDVAQYVGRPTEIRDLGDPEYRGCRAELGRIAPDGLRRVESDLVPAIVRHPKADNAPARVGPHGQDAAGEEGWIVGVRDHEQECAPAPKRKRRLGGTGFSA